MFRNRCRLRRWAAHLLFAWLFGLAIGVANACALDDAVHSEAGAGIARHAVAHHDNRHAPAHEIASCLDFCEQSTGSAPALKSAVDASIQVGAPALAPGYVPSVMVPDVQVDRPRAPRQERRGCLPLRIAYQRLSL